MLSTDLTAKRVPFNIPWGKAQQDAFNQLKELLCKAATEPLHIADFSKPFHQHVDSSNYVVGCLLSHPDENNTEKPIAFAIVKS